MLVVVKLSPETGIVRKPVGIEVRVLGRSEKMSERGRERTIVKCCMERK